MKGACGALRLSGGGRSCTMSWAMPLSYWSVAGGVSNCHPPRTAERPHNATLPPPRSAECPAEWAVRQSHYDAKIGVLSSASPATSAGWTTKGAQKTTPARGRGRINQVLREGS